MTVPAGSIKHVYNGNGVTRNWDYTFPIYTTDGSDITLYKTATDGTITEITSDYTVDVIASHVVYPTVASGLPLLATGEKITLLRVEPLSQASNWKNQGPFNSETVMAALDKLTAIVQQQDEELSRAIKYAVDQTPTTDDTDTFTSLLLGYKTDALAAKVAAQAAQAAAELAETNAETAETNAETAETNAESAQAAAEAARDLANTYKLAAQAAQTAAESARDTAVTAKNDAVTAKNDAVTAKNDAVTAKTAAETAETNAETAETNAETAETNAVSAKTAAETARDQAAAYAASAAGIPMATAGGTVDAITADYTPDMTLSNLAICAFVATGANTSTTPTFSPDGLTPHTITKKGGQALVAGDIPEAGAVCIVEYNLANTRWELLNPASDDNVKLTGDQTIAGIKTFSSIPILPASNPTIDNEASRKAYVDTKGDMKYADDRIAFGNFTRDLTAANGTQDISLPFTPKGIFIWGCQGGNLSITWGGSNGSSNYTIYINASNTADETVAYCIMMYVNGGNQIATCAFATDKATLSWTKNSSPTGTGYFKYIVWR